MRERWRSGLVLLLSALIFVGIVLFAPGSENSAFRRLIGIGDDPLGTPADVPEGGVYAFLEHQRGQADDPVAWDPCKEIHYEINPDGAPDGAGDTVAFVEAAVAEVSGVTGLRFVYDGRTDRRPKWGGAFVPLGGRRQPVLISWATGSEVDELKGNVAGLGGAAAREGADGRLRYITGGVTLDSNAFADLEDERDGEAYQRAILLHELGHLVGLDHVDSPAELMFEDNVGQRDFGRGDLNGLVRLGRGRCA
ncbi:matrixin family metalloprotease [Nocardioides sp. GCM10030258]|uniref:matrixin family metalloprotease n=1 Tax=unclassified Nocardioides TaxID=2615069 RepID=UPI0036140E65